MRVRAIHLVPRDSDRLVCANREPFLGPHPLCEAETTAAVDRFQAAVARGEYNERGYTPNEWAASRKKGHTT